MKILLDADMLLFRAMSATEVEVELMPDVWTRHSELPAARELYWNCVNDWCDYFNVNHEDVVHCFTDASAFRRDLFPDYKVNRKENKKPIGFKALRSEMLAEDFAFMYSKIEADDVIGILASQLLTDGEEYAIASGDKDMMQLPGLHIWLAAKEADEEPGLQINTVEINDASYVIKTTTPEYSERFTYRQYIQGDATDGIPGCKGVGEVGAKRVAEKLDLSRPVECWETIVRTYEEAWRKAKLDVRLAPSFALQQARLVRILRRDEYCFDTHQVTLWNPPTH